MPARVRHLALGLLLIAAAAAVLLYSDLSSRRSYAPAAAAPRQLPVALVQQAIRLGAQTIVSTYNEPLITAEWAVAVFKEARSADLVTGFVEAT